jgi:hypothetical protein
MGIWTRYEYVCVNCDTLIEITTLHKELEDPYCVCAESNIFRVGNAPAFAPVVTELTSNKVVKINTNPYN